MDENEKKHEIEWLMGSIKRDYARMKTKFIVNIILIIVFVLLVGFGHYTNAPEAKDMVDISIIDGPKWAVIAIWTLIGVFILFQTFSPYITGKRINKVSDARELIRILDQERKVKWYLIAIASVGAIAYAIISASTLEIKVINILILARELLSAKMDTEDMLWWFAAIVLSICLIVMGDITDGIIFIVLSIGTFLYRRYTGYNPKNDGPDNEIKQLRELLK